MAAKEMYDYLSIVTPDVDITLGVAPYDINPQGPMPESGTKNQIIHLGDDNSEARISFSNDSIFRAIIGLETLTESEAGTVTDIYYDTAKANARQKSFKWAHIDGHTYVIRFDCDMERVRRQHDIYGIGQIE